MIKNLSILRGAWRLLQKRSETGEPLSTCPGLFVEAQDEDFGRMSNILNPEIADAITVLLGELSPFLHDSDVVNMAVCPDLLSSFCRAQETEENPFLLISPTRHVFDFDVDDLPHLQGLPFDSWQAAAFERLPDALKLYNDRAHTEIRRLLEWALPVIQRLQDLEDAGAQPL
jgi:hypothetical protein